MIFFTVGTEKFPFERMIRAAEELGGKRLKEEVFVQTGPSTQKPSHCVSRPLLPFAEMKQKVADARVVVTHAGVGALLLCVSLGKNPILVPRLKRLGEHVDDHQIELAEKMAELGYVLLARETEEIVELVIRFDDEQKRLKPFSTGTPVLAQTLTEYLQ